jgi:hypothetical protein
MASRPQHVVVVAPEYKQKGTDLALRLFKMFWGGFMLMFALAWVSDHTGALSAHPGYWTCVVGFWLLSAVVSCLNQNWKPGAENIV